MIMTLNDTVCHLTAFRKTTDHGADVRAKALRVGVGGKMQRKHFPVRAVTVASCLC